MGLPGLALATAGNASVVAALEPLLLVLLAGLCCGADRAGSSQAPLE